MFRETLSQLIQLWMGLVIESPILPTQLGFSSMKIVSWNCQGAGDDDFRTNYRELVCIHSPDVVFLLETRVSPARAQEIAPHLGFSDFCIAPTDGMAGGIWMLWNSDFVEVDIKYVEDQCIHALVGPKKQEKWLLSEIYAKPHKEDKMHVFNNLESMARSIDIPWIVQGDFNEIAFSHEKQGGRGNVYNWCREFQQIISS